MANGIFGLLWPLTMLSNAFIMAATMPLAIRTFHNLNR